MFGVQGLFRMQGVDLTQPTHLTLSHTFSDSQATRATMLRVQGLLRVQGVILGLRSSCWAQPGVCRPVYLVKGILNGP